MSTKYTSHLGIKKVGGTSGTIISASTIIPGMGQVYNHDGNAVFQITPFQQLQRFLVLGSEGGSYYANEKRLTAENAKNVLGLVKTSGIAVVQEVVKVSKAGRAPSNDPALLVLALCAAHGDTATRKAALAALPEVARIGTHLFHFAEFVNSQRGWGRLLREGIRNWYRSKDLNELAFQMVKYQQRDGWSHADLLRLSHPKTGDEARNNLYKYVVKGRDAIEYGSPMPGIVIAFEMAKNASESELVRLIEDNNLPREAVPTTMLNSVKVWDTLLHNAPIMANTRNLAKMTSIGLLKQHSEAAKYVCGQLNNEEVIRKSRIHPYSLLVALKTYSAGRGFKGSLTWIPVPQIQAALQEALYMAFKNVQPSNKKHMLCLDVSGSMHGATIGGHDGIITAAEAGMVMALVTARTEEDYSMMGFSHEFKNLDFITKTVTLLSALEKTRRMNFGATDCSLPMTYARTRKIPVDVFTVYTDSETNSNSVQPFIALQQYRQDMGRDAKLIVCGMTASKFSIANPNDLSMLDVVGFDTAAPSIISDFAADRI